MKSRIFSCYLITLFGFVSFARAATDYDLARDYSTTANPSGAWTFGWKESLNGPLTPFGVFVQQTPSGSVLDIWTRVLGTPSQIFHNSSSTTFNSGEGTFPPNVVWFHPGDEHNTDTYGVIRFTAPESGN